MTQEEKAKAYDEALKKIRPLYEQAKKEDCPIWSTYEYIFPELAESEDERTIKELETFINQPEIADKITFEARIGWLAWLEKQKESLHIQETCKENADSFTDDIIEVRSFQREMEDGRRLEKQKEPHYTKRNALFDKCVENCDPEVMKEVSDEIDEMLKKEQKPVEIHIDNPNIEKFDPDVKVTTSDSSADGKELLYVSNKSYNIGYRDGVNSVKPAEWSEEDERIRRNLMSLLANMRGDRITEETYQKYYPWLSALRPSWKPSEEQMEVDLEKASRNVYESWMGGTMNDVRRDMVELGKVLNARKEDEK